MDLGLRGVLAPVLTPLTPDLQPDLPRMVEHARWLLEHGCHGLVVFGTTGEATSFAVEERMAVVDGLLQAGLPGDRLLVGTGCPSIQDTATLSAHAVRSGCAGVLVLPPYYYKDVDDQGLFRAYATTIERVGDPRLRMVLYHIPQVSHVDLSLDLIARLVESFPETVIGIKDSSGDWAHLKALLERFPGFGIFTGTERFLLPTLRHGGAGTICAPANVLPQSLRTLCDRWETPEAESLQAQITWLRDLLATLQVPAIPGLKALVAQRTGHEGWLRVRPPLLPLSSEQRERLQAAVAGRKPQAEEGGALHRVWTEHRP